ncbi:MAG: hypothetical protein ACI9C1_002185 [Candidatus Aldehydirespiratoraceae bacterium]
MYRIEIHHTTHVDGVPVAHHDAEVERRSHLPWWKQGFSPGSTGEISVEVEPYEGVYESEEEAAPIARELALQLAGIIREDSFVAIIRQSDQRMRGGYYPSGESG